MSRIYYPHTPDVVFEVIEQELIVLHLRQGNYYSFNSVGSLIFTHFVGGASVESLHKKLTEIFVSIPIEKLLAEANDFIELLCQRDLIILGGQHSSSTMSEKDEKLFENFSFQGAEYLSPSFECHTNLQDLLLLDPIHEVSEDGWPKQI